MLEAVFNHTLVLPQVYSEVKHRFLQLSDLAHGWEHVSRVYQLALHLAEHEGADPFIVGMAALLHDLGRTSTDVSHHADSSVTMAREILRHHKVPAEHQQAITHAILAHSFSRGIEPLTLEARVVRDADRLDALGAIGIMRWAIVSEQRCTPDTLSYHQDDPLGTGHTLDDRRYTLDHFPLKLLKLADTMTTETGRQMALRRTSFMRAYLHEFKRELEML